MHVPFPFAPSADYPVHIVTPRLQAQDENMLTPLDLAKKVGRPAAYLKKLKP